MIAASQGVSFTYDGLNRRDTITQSTGVESFTYNQYGYISEISAPTGTITRTTDRHGRVIEHVEQNSNNATTRRVKYQYKAYKA